MHNFTKHCLVNDLQTECCRHTSATKKAQVTTFKCKAAKYLYKEYNAVSPKSYDTMFSWTVNCDSTPHFPICFMVMFLTMR